MSDNVPVQPTRELRTEFARYVVAADPHTRMAGQGVFLVRRDVFTAMPEALLVGAYIGGTLYRPVDTGAEGPDTPVTGQNEGADTGADTPVDEPDTDPLKGEQHPTQAGLHVCTDCDKVAASAAGLAAHRRAKHEGE